MAKTGILGASIGLRDDGPGKSNRAITRKLVHLIKALIRENRDFTFDVATQWEVTDVLREDWELETDLDIPVQEKGTYLSGDELVEISAPFFRKRGVTEVIIVTDWLLWIKLFLLFRRKGFKVRLRGISWIPMDRKSIQPWTRNHVSLFVHAVRQVLLGYEGPYLEPSNYHVRVAGET